MPSSISSSEAVLELRDLPDAGEDAHAPRETASDRPGVAQPVPQRPVPPQPWNRIALGALALFALLLGGWEAYWRAFGATPGTRNTEKLWANQRRRIDAGEGGATVLVGASRVYFDVQLDVWQKLAGERPIQLAFEGTSPLGFLEDLAADPNFHGRVLVGVAPQVFFTGFAYRGHALKTFQKESPSQRFGQWLSMNTVERTFAFYDPDFALATVLKRQPWPERPGKHAFLDVRKLSVSEPDRATHLWSKVETDLDYREVTRAVWRQEFVPDPDDPPPEKMLEKRREQIARAAKIVATLRERHIPVLFVRPPSGGPFLEYEDRAFPRAETWDALLAATGAPGIHFQDYPELQGGELPEWSHLTHADAEKFTAALYTIVARDFWKKDGAAAATATATDTPAAPPPTAP